MLRVLVGCTLLTAVAAVPAVAQVEARQATPDEVAQMETGRAAEKGIEQMKNPMLLEIPLKLGNGMNVFAHFQRNGAFVWSTNQTARFVVDRANVRAIKVQTEKLKKKPDAEIDITIEAMIGSEWFRQDIDVTISLHDADGRQIARRVWKAETFGNDSGVTFGGRTKKLELTLKVRQGEFFGYWSTNPAVVPTLKVLLEVQGESDNEED